VIGSLRGVLLDRSTTGEVLVEVAGVGYRVTTPPSTLAGLGEVGDEAFLHVHHHIREDGQQLYGFATRDERRCFEALLGAHGVGPALALAILSVHQPDRLRTAVATDDIDALTLVPGVGRKTAARLLIELKSRLDVPELVGAPAGTNGDRAPARPSPLADVREALAGLGYGADEIRAAVAELPADDDADAGELLRAALQSLGVR
jgi:Holliday junction DNA helicase RuvA